MCLKPVPKTQTKKQQNWVSEPVNLCPNSLFLTPMMHTNLSAESSSEMSSASAQASSEPPARKTLRTEAFVNQSDKICMQTERSWFGVFSSHPSLVPHISSSWKARFLMQPTLSLSLQSIWAASWLTARGHFKNGMQCFFKPSFSSHTTDTHYSPAELSLESSRSHH